MEERDWVILESLHEKRSITKAAEALYISQPTLTGRLRQIEERFDVQIVIRGKKGVSFTPEGEYLVQCAREARRKMHIIEGTLRTIKNEIKGSLRIGASNFFSRHKLPELLRQFKTRYPEVEFTVVTGLSGKIVDLVYNHTIDIGFIRGEYDWSDKRDLLFEENMFIVSAREISIAHLPEIPRIDYISNKTVRDSLDNWWQQNFLRPPLVGMEVDQVDTCLEMVLKGLGYAFLPGVILDNAGPLYKVEMADRSGKPLSRRTWMFYHHEALEIGLVKTFVDFVNGLDIRVL